MLTSPGPSGFLGAEGPGTPHEVACGEGGYILVPLRSELQALPSCWTLGSFPVGKRKMILPGWLKKRPQQGAGKCVSKHGSSQHSQALLGLAPRLEAAPEGRSPTWGRWGVGRAHQPHPGPRPVQETSVSPPQRSGGPRRPSPAPAGAHVAILQLHVCVHVSHGSRWYRAHTWLPLPSPCS